MKLFALSRRQLAVRLGLLAVAAAAGTAVLYVRACPHWEPSALAAPPVDTVRESPFIDPAGTTQETRILPPAGYTRVPAGPDSFAAYLRAQPVYPDGSRILRYDGVPLGSGDAAAVYTLSMGKDGWQQCADTIIRLRADYAYTQGKTEALAYHFTNGFLCDYASWCRGKRAVVLHDLAFWMPLALPADNEQTYHDWLMQVMHYAGTLSLEKESEPVPAAEAHTGDIICHGGAPGHVVLLADEAQNAAGERCFLIAQGFTPSQSCHIITGYGGEQNPWYTEEQLAAQEIRLSGYVFHAGELRRFVQE